MKNYIAFFDIDKTILNINSGPALVREAYKAGLMGKMNLIKAIYLSWMYKFNLRDTAIIIAEMGKWLKGLPLDEVSKLSERVVNMHLIKAIRPEIYSEINLHREHDAEIVILSSAIEEICRPLGSHLGADNLICTKMEVNEGVLTGLPEKKFCFSDEKRVRLIAYCESKRYKLSDAFYYADSISDLNALETVGHPVCVVPDSRLARIALRKGWTVLY